MTKLAKSKALARGSTGLLAGAVFALSCFSSPTIAKADTLIENVDGLTVGEDGEIDRFATLWIDDDGRVRATFERGERLPEIEAVRIDGQGRTMVPGLIDSHLHVMDLGFLALKLDLSGTSSLEEAQSAIKTFAEANPNRPWILGDGWNQEKWGLGRYPTAAELDAVVADRPVYLRRVDGHAGWANTRAMTAAGIDRKTGNISGGAIEKDGSGNPTGIFVDAAESLFAEVLPKPRAAERDLALAEAQAGLIAKGITAVADMGTTIEDWQAFRRAGDLGRLQIRIMSYSAGIDAADLIGGTGPTPWLYNDRLRLNGVKLYLDGALGSRGAWLKQPYADAPAERGLAQIDPTRLRNILSRAALANLQPAIHAIGDAANAEALSAIEEMTPTYTGDRRWRIEHAQKLDPVDLPRLGASGIIASMQPLHQPSDRVMAEARLGPDRLAGAYAWRSLAATGARLAFGSDAPVEPADVLSGMAAAISRTDARGEPFGGWIPQEAVSREESLAAFTADGAYAGFAEGRFGRLVSGEWADFVLLDLDPTLASADQLRETHVLSTWIAGKEVYRRR